MSTTAPDDAQFLSALTLPETVTSTAPGDEAWATIPIEDDPTPADVSGFQLVSDIADFARPLPGIEPASADPEAVVQGYGQDLNFDFDTGEPTGMEYGNLTYVDDEQQVEQWIAKALATPSARYQIYPVDYGSALDSLVGAAGPDATIFSEVARTVQDCLTAHPRVVQASVDAVFREPLAAVDGLFVSTRIWLDSSDDPLELTLGVS
jgi:phage baseplate assembly protein W